MNKLLYLTTACLMLSACGGFNDKQPIDSTYYKKTQSVAWPTEQKKVTNKKAPVKVQAKTQSGTTVTKTISTTTTTSETTTYTK